MHAAVLQALEFTRIVDVLRGAPARRSAPSAWRSSARSPTRGKSPSCSRPPPRACGSTNWSEGSRCRRRPTWGPFWPTWPWRAARSSRCGCWAWPTSSSGSRRPASAIRRTDGSFPTLKALAEGGAAFRGEIAETRHKIEPSGEVADGASPELKGVRERLRRQRTRLKGTLESFLRNKRHGQVPAGPGRHRPQRAVRARGARRAPDRRSRASSTAARRAAPACSSSR